MKKVLIGFFLAVLVVMTWFTVSASLEQGVTSAAAEIWADPWGKATLFDAYFAFLTVYIWIAYRERTWPRQLVWLLAILLSGNFAIAGYFLFALLQLPAGESWTALFRRRVV